MMSWMSRIFDRSGRSSGKDYVRGELVSVLNDQIKAQIKKAKRHSTIPRTLIRDCQRCFAENLEDIAEKVVQTDPLRPANYAYTETGSAVFMVVSVLPWTTEQAILELSERSDDPPFGYTAMMTNLFFNNWPSPDLTHFFHVLLCLGGDICHMHTVMGHYGGFPGAETDFVQLPVDLLNAEERSRTGL